ncbi:UTP--glucose-1-phosphate uridylyltransferase, partial [Rhizobium glycinendophyticum]
ILANVAFAIERPDIRPSIEQELKAILAALK